MSLRRGASRQRVRRVKPDMPDFPDMHCGRDQHTIPVLRTSASLREINLSALTFPCGCLAITQKVEKQQLQQQIDNRLAVVAQPRDGMFTVRGCEPSQFKLFSMLFLSFPNPSRPAETVALKRDHSSRIHVSETPRLPVA